MNDNLLHIRAAAIAIQEAGPVGCCNITDEKAIELAKAALQAVKELGQEPQFSAGYGGLSSEKELTQKHEQDT